MAGGVVSGWAQRLGQAIGIAEPHEPQRWVVLDVETTGLDTDSAELLAVAAVAVHRRGEQLLLAAADSFEALLRHDSQARSDEARANVLLHGIGLGEQRRGGDPAEVLRALAAWTDGAPLLGFHVGFDRRMLQRATARWCADAALRGPWLDIEALAAISQPSLPRGALDDWLDRYRIPCAHRHQAAADTLATAELLLRLWPQIRETLPPKHRRSGTVGALVKMEASRRWLSA
jgi:DNA polymerase-3 subunit epsilon